MGHNLSSLCSVPPWEVRGSCLLLLILLSFATVKSVFLQLMVASQAVALIVLFLL